MFARFECGMEDRVRKPLGPYEWMQLTYTDLRVAPEGESIACFRDGFWHVDGDVEVYSDVVLYASREGSVRNCEAPQRV